MRSRLSQKRTADLYRPHVRKDEQTVLNDIDIWLYSASTSLGITLISLS